MLVSGEHEQRQARLSWKRSQRDRPAVVMGRRTLHVASATPKDW